MVLLTRCDRCGNVHEHRSSGMSRLETSTFEARNHQTFDLCKRCVRALRSWILEGTRKRT